MRVFGGSPTFWLMGGDVLNKCAVPLDSTKLLHSRFTQGGFAHALAGSKMEDLCFLLKKSKMPAGPWWYIHTPKKISDKTFGGQFWQELGQKNSTQLTKSTVQK